MPPSSHNSNPNLILCRDDSAVLAVQCAGWRHNGGARLCGEPHATAWCVERAKSLHERRSKARQPDDPSDRLLSLLLLTCFAVWSGLYQYQAAEAAEAVQTDVAALAASDANNQFLVVLLWFVPVSLRTSGCCMVSPGA